MVNRRLISLPIPCGPTATCPAQEKQSPSNRGNEISMTKLMKINRATLSSSIPLPPLLQLPNADADQHLNKINLQVSNSQFPSLLKFERTRVYLHNLSFALLIPAI